MTKKTVWEACLQQEITPALPLHDPAKGWIPAEYSDGTVTKVDLTTLLKDLHRIKDVDLGHTASTAALYRVVLSIMYKAIDFNTLDVEDGDEWDVVKPDLVVANKGLDEHRVKDYFTTFQDRFYLLHPRTPFLQDASLFRTIGVTEPNGDNIALVRKELSKTSGTNSQSIRSLHPLGISPANGDQSKIPTWGVPRENFLEPTDPEDSITTNLMLMLFYLRYSHPAMGSTARYYWGQDTEAERKANDTYPAAHAFRCALNYVVTFPTLYQTLLFAMEYFEPEELERDLPEWEKPVNQETGYLDGLGFDRRSSEVASYRLPRSSVNLTHQAIALVPQYDSGAGSMAENGGVMYALRCTLFNFKNETVEVQKKAKKGEEPRVERVKKPSPMTWNPFVVEKTVEGKALKATSPISRETYVANRGIPQILTAYDLVDMNKPKPLRDMEVEDVSKKLSPLNPYVKIMVFSGDPAKQKDYADLVIRTKETGRIAHNKLMSERVDVWLNSGRDLAFAVAGNVRSSHTSNSDDKLLTQPTEEFWTFYSALFDHALQSDSIPELKDYESQILAAADAIFEQHTEGIATQKPMTVAQHQMFMRGRIRKILR